MAASSLSHREALLDAGPRLAERLAYPDLTPEGLADAAGVTPADFKREFGTLTPYLVELQQRFLTALRDEVLAVALKETGGLARVRAGSLAFFERCLAKVALRRWLVEARYQPEVLEGLLRQNQSFMLILSAEFGEIGYAHPAAASRLYVAMLYEVSIAELQLGAPLPKLRAALFRVLSRGQEKP